MSSEFDDILARANDAFAPMEEDLTVYFRDGTSRTGCLAIVTRHPEVNALELASGRIPSVELAIRNHATDGITISELGQGIAIGVAVLLGQTAVKLYPTDTELVGQDGGRLILRFGRSG